MAIELQLRRGTTAENDLFTGALAEVTVDTNKHKLRVHDGSTQGGFSVALESDITDKISNCITEIPQDINLELNNGTLTLKAGSSAYMPNGSGVFTKCTSSANLTYSATWGAGHQCFITGYVNANGNLSGIGMCRSDLAFSGTTQPSTTINGAIWYDTSVNKIKTMRNGSWVVDSVSESRTFFLGIVTVGTGNIITSIDQIFNGFGYIGSTVFALPGVKGLIPNGRNTDGSLNNTAFVLNSVKTQNISAYTSRCTFAISDSGFDYKDKSFEQEDSPNTTYSYWYKPSENLLYESGSTASYSRTTRAIAGRFYRTNGVISEFEPKQVFHAVDYSDYIQASGTVVAEQLPTSANDYTWFRKYANGWVEQGGQVPAEVVNIQGTVNLPIAMSDTNYFVTIDWVDATAANGFVERVRTRTTTNFAYGTDNWQATGQNMPKVWLVKGLAA